MVIAGVKDRAPFEFSGLDGKPCGIFVEIWNLWSEKTGIAVDYRLVERYRAFEMVRKGSAHAMGAIAKNADISFEYSESYYKVGAHVFFNARMSQFSTPGALDAYRVGFVQGDMAAGALRIYRPELSTRVYPSFSALTADTAQGKLSVFVANPQEALHNLGNAVQAWSFRHENKPLYSVDIHFAVRKGDLPLLGILESGFRKITPAEISAIERRFAGISVGHRVPWAIVGVGILFAFALGGGIVVWFWNHQLQQRIRVATSDLRENQECLVQSQSALSESEERFRGLSEAAFEAIFIHKDGVILETNPAAADLFGYGRPEIIGSLVSDFIAEETAGRIQEILNAGPDTIVETTGLKNGGTTFILELRGRSARHKGADVLVTAMQDITARKKSESQMRASEKRYKATFQSIPDAVSISSLTDSRFLYVNDAFCGISGFSRSEVIGRTPESLNLFVLSRNRYNLKRLLEKDGEVTGLELKYRTKHGTVLDTLLSARHMRYEEEACMVVISKDITAIKNTEAEKSRLERQLQQIRKMESIGTLAGGIAHDFNNILMGILGNISLIQMKTDPEDTNHAKLSTIENLVTSGSDLTRQLLGFARSGKYEVKVTDLTEIVKNNLRMFGRTHKNISIYDRYQEDLWNAAVDRSQIEQVLLNIFVNASHAMESGGDLTVSTKNVELEEAFTRIYGATPGRFVKISITDTGVGMDDDTKNRIFDPFFTTKEMGRGTGLGLASAYGIIANHGGLITVRSRTGEGSRFNIYLPASRRKEPVPLQEELQLLTGSELLLFVEDEETVREMGIELLTELGYTVLTAEDGYDAIDLYETEKDRIAMVILDMIMPGLGGEETFEALRHLNPHVRVLLASGYTLDGQAETILAKGCDGFIQKPYDMRTLSHKIRDILDTRPIP